ncbi:MAG TPA: DUF433 domain-containing protein [Candidatus Saccharimonadales bacterium]|nr:DUF433 domain-containing protein [Candidatus Saccharimonadales bacterium]
MEKEVLELPQRSRVRLAEKIIYKKGVCLVVNKSYAGSMNASKDLRALVGIDREIMSGAPVFAGTRVPVQTLFDYLEGGDDLEEFLEDFPSVSREHALRVLEAAKDSLLIQAASTCA